MKKALMLLIRGYQKLLSPILPKHCRFEPTCSQFALEVLQKERLPKALWRILKRIGSCHPFHPGGHDPS